ncbi:MAG: glycogen/starch synthase [Anaerolineales bacterium]
MSKAFCGSICIDNPPNYEIHNNRDDNFCFAFNSVYFFMHILMVSAENGALPGAKVGGMGDVVGQVAPALADRGCRVTVMTPCHGFLHRLPGAAQIGTVEFMLRGYWDRAELFEVPGHPPHGQVRNLVVHHPRLSAWDPVAADHRIYVHDPPDHPFATDASRFALFCAAAAAAVTRQGLGPVDVIHLHDWHTALMLILRKFDPHHRALTKIRTVFSIHNLALQGIRPLRGDDSSLEAWFPGLGYDWFDVADPHVPDCVNLMAAGIRLADVIHTVSPTYAREILRPSQKPAYYGGERLEAALQYAADRGALIGILNGCVYPDGYAAPKMTFDHMLNLFKSALVQWAGRRETLPSALFIAHARLLELERRLITPEIILASVGRVVPQKIQLMRAAGSDSKSGLEGILENLGDSGCLFLLGTGDEEYEYFLTRLSSRYDNFIFLNGYSDQCARALYANGELFLMPSSYEPCGISQMLAMRDGQPSVIHAVGGLKDTVQDGINGFIFSGQTLIEQVDNFVRTTLAAVALKQNDPDQWLHICDNAVRSRFSWDHTARQYLEKLYGAFP